MQGKVWEGTVFRGLGPGVSDAAGVFQEVLGRAGFGRTGPGCRRLASGSISRVSAGDLGMSGLFLSETEENGGGGRALRPGESSLSISLPFPQQGQTRQG